MITGVEIEAFCYPTEDLEKVKQAFMAISPVKPSISRATTHFGASIIVLTARLTHRKEIRDFINRLKSMPEEQLSILKDQLLERIDEKGNFYIRFDKFKALDGELRITNSSDGIRAIIKFTTYPMSIDKVIDEIEGLL